MGHSPATTKKTSVVILLLSAAALGLNSTVNRRYQGACV